jgi:transposase
MSHKSAPSAPVSTIGIDLGKNSFHLVGLDQRGAIVLQLKCSRAQLERRLANISSCLVGIEACSGAHYIGRQLAALGHDVRLIPAQNVKPFLPNHSRQIVVGGRPSICKLRVRLIARTLRCTARGSRS